MLVCFLMSCDNVHNHGQGVNTDKPDETIVIVPTNKDEVDTVKKSLPALATENINGNRLTIRYHSPAVRNRIIWGGLVPYDQVWVTGAHSATTLESKSDFLLADTKVPGGKYAFFTIPGKDEWTVILNKNWEQHLADEYNQVDDIVRVKVKPQTAEHQERLMYLIDQTGERRCQLEMHWEKICIKVPMKLAD